MNEQAARRKVSTHLLSLGTAAQESITDKLSQMIVPTVSLQELKDNCEQAFGKR